MPNDASISQSVVQAIATQMVASQQESYGMRISEAVSDIRNQNLVLPEFQREYVWSREQAKQLLVSLIRKYPVGGLLFWKTQDPPELKNVDTMPEKLGTVQVILDGQQRLTTLYMLVTGEIPPYYVSQDITNDIRNLYYNLDDGDLQYFQPVRMRDNPRWVRVVDCFTGSSVDVFAIAQKTVGQDEAAFQQAQAYDSNLGKLKDIRETDLPVQVVSAEASLDDAIDVFDRLNSLGTKLTDAELALTHVTGKWSQARKTLKAKMDQLREQRFEFDLGFMTRALVCTITGHALFQQIHAVERPRLEEGWLQLSRILDYIAGVLPGRAYIHSTQDMSSTNPLIPVVRFLKLHGGKFQSEASLRSALHWLYLAQIHQWYAGQVNSRLEHDVTIVNREDSPWPSLLNQIIDQRGRSKVLPDDFEGRGTAHPLYRASFVLAKANHAVDWFNGTSLTTPIGASYGIHSHHIFPQSALYESGYSPDSHVDRQLVNAIANRAFLSGQTNLSIGNRLPEDYLPEVEARYPGALKKQFIPVDSQMWTLGRYRDFLSARRQLLADGLNQMFDRLISDDEPSRSRPLNDLIGMGEGMGLEFKSTLQWDVVQGKQNKGLRDAVLKTLVAFMNTEGGTTLIGVEDSGQIFGLERDLKLVGDSPDRFLQLLNSLVADRIGVQYTPHVVARMDSVEGKSVCVVDVSRAPEPAFLSGQTGREFYVRVGNTTRALDSEQTLMYLEHSP